METKTKTDLREIAEYQFFKELLLENPNGILSLVSDTFSLFTVVTEFLPRLKNIIMGRNGKLVIRPDSGDPVDIVCGSVQHFYGVDGLETAKVVFEFDIQNSVVHGKDKLTISESRTVKVGGKYFKLTANIKWGSKKDKKYFFIKKVKIKAVEVAEKPEFKGVIELLWDIFSGTVNEEGYKVLDSHIGAIYGDSINLERQLAIYERLAAKGFAVSNIVLGIGSFTYQYNTRDTFGFAAKGANFETSDNMSYPIYKDPATDDGTKKSLKGYQRVDYDENGEIIVISNCTEEEEKGGLLHTIYENGEFYNLTTFTEIRNRLEKLV